MIALWVGLAWANDCPAAAAATSADLESTLEAAEASYATLDVDNLVAATDRALGQIDCVTDPIPRSLAAAFHRTQGLRAFADRDAIAARRWFAAARTIEPGYTFPESLVPPGNPLLDDYAAVDLIGGTTGPLKPGAGRITIDGRDAAERPLSWPAILQVYDATGAVWDTELLRPGEPTPDYPKPTQKRGPTWALAAGTTTVVSALYLASAHNARSKWASNDTPYDQLDDYRAKTNTRSTLSGLLFMGGLGLGVTAVIVWDKPEKEQP